MDKNAEPCDCLIVFDGVCNFCDSSVNFIIKRDRNRFFKFAAMQSAVGQRLLAAHDLSSDNIDSFLLVKSGKVLFKSDAVAAVAKELDRPWNHLAVLRIVPRPMRDFLYSLIARNRYRWFGRREYCRAPTPELKDRFFT